MTAKRLGAHLIAIVTVTVLVGFTPSRVRLSATVEVEGPSSEALSAIAAEIVTRGGRLVTSPSKEGWYVVEGISVSLSAGEQSVAVEASMMRGPGCSEKTHQKYWGNVSAVIDQLVAAASKKSGIPMRYVAKEEPNQPLQRNAGSRPSSDDYSASESPSSLGPRG